MYKFEMNPKKQREILVSQGFRCVNCQRSPDMVSLKVLIADSNGDPLSVPVIQCVDCVREPNEYRFEKFPVSKERDLKIIAERQKQIEWFREFEEVLRARRKSKVKYILALLDSDYTWPPEHFSSVENFIKKLGEEDVEKAVGIARSKRIGGGEQIFRYFAGICWNWIKER